jgi:hypothetical protein
MTVFDSTRRLGVAVIGLVGALTITVGCSSSTSGKAASNSAPASASVPAPSISVSLPASLPASLPVSLPSQIPTLGGSQFCKDLSAMGNLGSKLSGSPSDLGTVEAALDKLAAEAPDQIKSDVQALRDYIKGAVSGHIDPSAAQKLETAESHLISYVTSHCHA